MHIITRKRLNDFAERHPDVAKALARWYRTARSSEYASFAALRRDFPSADQVAKYTVFDIGGNKVRLVTAIHYNRKKIYVRAVLTHAEYDEGKWKV